MTASGSLRPASVLFWMVALVAVGIIVIGVRFLVVPLPAAAAFGVPVDPGHCRAYLAAKGTRDIVSGLFFIVLLWNKAGRRLVGELLYVASLIALGDMVNVYLNRAAGSHAFLYVHGGTALFMLVVATLLVKRS